MKTILSIETSTPAGSVALWRKGGKLREWKFRSERNHNSQLFPVLENGLAELGDEQLDLIITGTGPGSYNGSRIAIAVAQGIGTVRGCPTVGLGSFHGMPAVTDEQRVLICGDARRQEYYIQLAEKGALQGEIELYGKEGFIGKIEEAKQKGACVVSAEDLERISFLGELQAQLPEAGRLIRAWQGFSAEEKERLLHSPPEPAYLRPPHITKAKPRKKLQS